MVKVVISRGDISSYRRCALLGSLAIALRMVFIHHPWSSSFRALRRITMKHDFSCKFSLLHGDFGEKSRGRFMVNGH